jgi:hypothetical protein
LTQTGSIGVVGKTTVLTDASKNFLLAIIASSDDAIIVRSRSSRGNSGKAHYAADNNQTPMWGKYLSKASAMAPLDILRPGMRAGSLARWRTGGLVGRELSALRIKVFRYPVLLREYAARD